MHGACLFSKIELKSGYHQICMKDADKWKTNFKTKYTLMVSMPFSLPYAPRNFIRLMPFRSFHNLASFYQRFVKDFSIIATPLTNVIKKNVAFTWGVEHDKAFIDLKERLYSAPILALPNFDCTFEIECNALGIGIGVVLIHNRRSIAYFSKKLTGVALQYPTYDKKL